MKPIEESFARAMRLKLKSDPEWGWYAPHTDERRMLKLTHDITGKVVILESVDAASQFLDLVRQHVRFAIDKPKARRRGWRLESI